MEKVCLEFKVEEMGMNGENGGDGAGEWNVYTSLTQSHEQLVKPTLLPLHLIFSSPAPYSPDFRVRSAQFPLSICSQCSAVSCMHAIYRFIGLLRYVK